MSEYFQADPKILGATKPLEIALAHARHARHGRPVAPMCPACHTVARASDHAALRYGLSWQGGDVKRRCPNCGHVAATWRVQVVRERHG
jgi:hypothetical protein